MEKVAILVSTYNGEKYIQEQLKSLFNQTYKNIEIYVRDDGSKDNTINILQKYSSKIKIKQGKNVGFVKSFFELLTYCNDAKYYAFCDQDDIWLPEKIEKAVNKLKTMSQEKPTLYASNFDYYDAQMKYLKPSGYKKKNITFRNSIVECVAPGMTMCMNDVARNELITHVPQNCMFHDWWTYMVCSGIGEVYYDSNITVKYRKHEENVTLKNYKKMNFFRLQIWRIKNFIIGNHFKKVKEQLIEYNSFYGEKLEKNDQKILNIFISKKYKLILNLKKLFYPKMFRSSIMDEILIRAMFLIGKL